MGSMVDAVDGPQTNDYRDVCATFAPPLADNWGLGWPLNDECDRAVVEIIAALID
jgi:hypothetical protein